MDSAQQPADPSAASPAPQASPPWPHRRMVVRAIIFAAGVLTVLTVGLLYYRWLTVEVPTALVLVTGDEAANSAVVTLTGRLLPEPMVITLNDANAYTARFQVRPGLYQLRIVQNSQELLEHEGPLNNNGWFISLNAPATRPRKP